MLILGILLSAVGMVCFIVSYVTEELVFIIGGVMFFLLGSTMIFVSNNNPYKVNQNWHYDGEIMVLNKDTVIVTQASRLNKLYKDLKPTDSLHEVNILQQCTTRLDNRVLLYDKKEYESSNKIDELSVLVTKDTIFINTQ